MLWTTWRLHLCLFSRGPCYIPYSGRELCRCNYGRFHSSHFGYGSGLVIVTSPIQAGSSLIKTVFSPFRAVASVSTRSGRNRSCSDERLSAADRFRSDEEPLRAHLQIPSLRESGAPSVQSGARRRHGTSMVAALPPAASTVFTPRMEVAVYIFSFQYWLDGRRLLSMDLEGTSRPVLFRKSRRDTAAGAWARQNGYVGPTKLPVDSFNSFSRLSRHVVSTL